MKLLKLVGLFLGGMFLLTVVIGLLLPSQYHVERSLVMDAPIEIIFEQVNNLEKNKNWSPWNEADPTMVVTYGEKKSGVGAFYSWTSKKSGAGTLTILESEPPVRIKSKLEFEGQGISFNEWFFEETEQGVNVTESFYGDMGYNIIQRYFGLFIDSFIGPFFDRGLANLKKIAESEAQNLQNTPQEAPDDEMNLENREPESEGETTSGE